jgi:hypothetical protein
LEIGYFRDGYGRLEVELRNLIEANQLLRAEVEQLKAVHGLPQCELENRWSNCAVRMRKLREMKLSGSAPAEVVDDGAKLNRGNSRLRRFADMLFKTSTRHGAV